MSTTRIFKSTVAEGSAIPFVAFLVGPDNMPLTFATTGQTGVSSVDLSVYERSSTASPQTSIYGTNIPTTECMVNPTPVVGDGYTDDPLGYNFFYLFAGNDALAVLEGGHTYLFEFRAHMTGTRVVGAKTYSWGDNILLIEVTVLPRYSQ